MNSLAYDLPQWSAFFSAEVGATAALTGLLFVAVSINLSKIIAIPLLTARSAEALSKLAGVLVAATLCLVPGHSTVALGWELLAVGIIAWILITRAERASSRNNPYTARWQSLFHTLMAQGAGIPTIVAGASLVAGRGGGLYWLVAATVLSIVAALIDAWVLLIEIHR
jgi:hypothetical protein